MLEKPTNGLFVAITTRSKLIQCPLALTRRFSASNSLAAVFSNTCEPSPATVSIKPPRYFRG